MNSAKTLNLLAVAHNYEMQGKEIIIAKPALDTRFKREYVTSRCGLEKPASILLHNSGNLKPLIKETICCILVDECQFLGVKIIEELRAITVDDNIPVLCYGLRTDYKSQLFPASKRLMELADSIEEIKSECSSCRRKATMNKKIGNFDSDSSIVLGAEEKFSAVCYKCFKD